jgi:DNA-binding SARP family transcriptional activator
MLRVRILGDLALEENGQPLAPPVSRRARALLGLLAVERRAHPRSQLAARFWPDVLDESARTSLRSALSTLRKSLGRGADRYLITDRETVALAGSEEVWIDLAEFDALVAAGRCEDALELCRGALLEGLDDDWVYERRDEHRDRVADTLAQLAAEAEARSDPEAAVAFTRRQVALDPLAEDPQRELIRRLAAAGDRPTALAAYRRLRDRLRSELGIAPSAQTRELVETVRGAESPGARPAAAQPASPARPTGTVTLLFTDQVSSTEMLQRLGDEEAERLRRAHFKLLREVAGAHGGTEVKNLGDGLMVAFASAVDAVVCAIAIQQAVHRGPEADTLKVRVGLNVGEPIVDEDDYFGTPVVVAKRLCDAADAGQILAADVVRVLVGTRGGFDFTALEPVALKGIGEPVAACEVGWKPASQQPIPLPPAVVGVAEGVFVGRADARSELEREWREVLGGQRRVVLVAGEPGIGKTRLTAEFCRAAHADGAAVLVGRCYEDTLVPYGPFAEALRAYVASCPLTELTVQLAPHRRELSLLVPELGGEAVEWPPPGQAEPERIRLFEAVAGLLAAASLARPTILVLDDLHWADDASLLLLRHIVRATERSPLMLLGTFRATELDRRGGLAAAIAELRRARALHELSLEGLGEPDVAALIAVQSGEQAPTRFARHVVQHTDGNPFFIEELLRHVGVPGTADSEELDIPESVKDLLRRRLARLEEGCQRTLAIAAVAGRQFELAVLERLGEGSAEEIVELLDGAVEAQVLVEEPSAIGRYRFAHPLIRETIYTDISVNRRALIHRRVADTLESLYAERLAEEAGVLAYHYRAAGVPEKAFEYHCQAADVAERAAAYEAAFEHLTGAIAAGELLGRSARSSAEIADLHRRRAWLAWFVDADELADRDLEVALAAARALGDRALEMQVLNVLGLRWHVLDSERAIACHEQSLAIAEELDHAAGQVSALNRLSLVCANQLDLLRARELGERALELAGSAGDDDAQMRAMDSLKFVALALGDIGSLEELTSKLELIQRAGNQTWFLQWTLLEGSFVALARARFDDAVAKLDEAVDISRRIGDSSAAGLMLHGRCWARRLQGDYGRALADGRASLALAEHGGGPWHGWLAMTLAMALRELSATEEAREILEVGFDAAERIDTRLQILSCAADLAYLRWQTGDEPGALKLVTRTESLLDEVRTPPRMAYLYTISTYTSAARTALAAGQPERAQALIGRYLEAAGRSRIGYAAAEGKLVLARCAQARGSPEEAKRLLAEALAEVGSEGLPTLRREIHAALVSVAGDEAAEHAVKARELIETIAGSVSGEPLADEFRATALAELEAATLVV